MADAVRLLGSPQVDLECHAEGVEHLTKVGQQEEQCGRGQQRDHATEGGIRQC